MLGVSKSASKIGQQMRTQFRHMNVNKSALKIFVRKQQHRFFSDITSPHSSASVERVKGKLDDVPWYAEEGSRLTSDADGSKKDITSTHSSEDSRTSKTKRKEPEERIELNGKIYIRAPQDDKPWDHKKVTRVLGGVISDAKFIRYYKGSPKPLHMRPSTWQGLSYPQKLDVVAEESKRIEKFKLANLVPAKPALLAAEGAVPVDRVMWELCCEPDSVLSLPQFQKTKCKCIRITQRDDLLNEKTLKRIVHQLENATEPVFVWMSFPCVAGCPYWRYNKKHPTVRDKCKVHIDLIGTAGCLQQDR